MKMWLYEKQEFLYKNENSNINSEFESVCFVWPDSALSSAARRLDLLSVGFVKDKMMNLPKAAAGLLEELIIRLPQSSEKKEQTYVTWIQIYTTTTWNSSQSVGSWSNFTMKNFIDCDRIIGLWIEIPFFFKGKYFLQWKYVTFVLPRWVIR